MHLESTKLEENILRGGRAAYLADHPWKHPSHPKFWAGCTYEHWLGLAGESSQLWRELSFWCERAYNGESRVHISKLPVEDQNAIIVARRVFRALIALEEMALAPTPVAA
jgi:hypothetical protein